MDRIPQDLDVVHPGASPVRHEAQCRASLPDQTDRTKTTEQTKRQFTVAGKTATGCRLFVQETASVCAAGICVLRRVGTWGGVKSVPFQALKISEFLELQEASPTGEKLFDG